MPGFCAEPVPGTGGWHEFPGSELACRRHPHMARSRTADALGDWRWRLPVTAGEVRRQVGPRPQTELSVDAGQVHLDCLGSEEEHPRHLPVGDAGVPGRPGRLDRS